MDNELEERVNRDEDDESQSSSDEEEDEDELQYNKSPTRSFAAIDRNDPNVRSVCLYPHGPSPMSLVKWLALGRNIGKNTSLKRFNVILDEIEENVDDISSAEKLRAFCIGVAHNRSLENLMVQDCDLGRAGLHHLHPFVIENDNLTDLTLYMCNLNLTDIRLLADAFARRRNPESIKRIEISGRDITDESVRAIVELSNCCPRLKTLKLSYSRIGDRGCNHLASMLSNPESRLKRLKLNNNPISDEGAQILANSITNNKILAHLEMENIVGITSRGWDAFIRVLSDPSSINTTYYCNHTLKKLWGLTIPHGMPFELLLALKANEEKDKVNVAQKKIINLHLGGNFDLSPFMGMDAKLLPLVLGLVEKERTNSLPSRLSTFYRIIRNLPGLCSFPSREKKHIQRLEQDITTLNGKVIELEEKNEQLMREIEILKSKKRQKC